ALRVRLQREPHVGGTNAGSLESVGRNTNDSDDAVIESYSLADHSWIAVEAPRPEAVIQYCDRGAVRFVCAVEESADSRYGAKNAKIVCRYIGDKHVLHSASGHRQFHRTGKTRMAVHSLQSRGALSNVAVVRIRSGGEADSFVA